METNVGKWPILYGQLLRLGNPQSSVGICTLWTERDKAREHLDPTSYCAIGNLYRAAGISPMIRNIFANPRLRYIVLWGRDLSGSGDALVRFMQAGVDAEHRIAGGPGRIEKEIDRESLELFRRAVRVIDLRNQPIEALRQTVQGLDAAAPFTEPRIFPMAVPSPRFFPSERTGFRVESPTVAQAWLKVIRTVMAYGRPKSTRYTNTNQLKEILNLTAVVTAEDPEDVYFPEYLPFPRGELDGYYDQVLTPKEIQGLAYTYGQRLRNHHGVDQIQEMIDLAKARPDSKKLYASTWDVPVDSPAAMAGDTPCLTQVLGSVQEDRFYLTAHFRSQDMYHGWPRNMFAMRRLQKLIADGIGLPLGAVTMITHSAHIYADDWDAARETIDRYSARSLWHKQNPRRELDPRGYITISVVDGKIVAVLYSPEDEELATFSGSKARELYAQIADGAYLVMPSHLLYLGGELQKAELARRLGQEYVQDKDLGFYLP